MAHHVKGLGQRENTMRPRFQPDMVAAVLGTDHEERKGKLALGVTEVAEDGARTRVVAAGGVSCGWFRMHFRGKTNTICWWIGGKVWEKEKSQG